MASELTEPKVQILDAALKFLRHKGPRGVTMRRVAKAVGVTAPALYRHFPNREAILGGIADLGFDMIGTRMEEPIEAEDPSERVLVLFGRYIQFALDEPEVFDLMFRVEHSNVRKFPRDYVAGKSRSGNVLIREVKQCFTNGVWREDGLADVVLTIWVHAHGIAVLALAKRIEGDDEHLRAVARDSMKRVIAGLTRT